MHSIIKISHPCIQKYAHEKAATIAVQIKKAKHYITAILLQLITVVSSSDIRELTAQQRQPMRSATSIKFHFEPKNIMLSLSSNSRFQNSGLDGQLVITAFQSSIDSNIEAMAELGK